TTRGGFDRWSPKPHATGFAHLHKSRLCPGRAAHYLPFLPSSSAHPPKMTRQKGRLSSERCSSARLYCLRCVGLAAGSVKKIRRLSENSENLLTNGNAGKVTVAPTAILV